MGGYGSGRLKQHTITDECIPIDTTFLRQRDFLPRAGQMKTIGGQLVSTHQATTLKRQTTTTQHTIHFFIKHYGPGDTHTFTRWGAAGHLTLMYGVQTNQEPTRAHRVDIPLVTTPCNYGGSRYWLLAPCCGRRVRVVYLPTAGGLEGIVPACRTCLDLHYASQQQSAIERQKTYEKYLLANYGYAWAQIAYRQLEHHYFDITPEWEYIRAKSVFDRELELLRHMISFQRTILKSDLQALASLKSEEDRREFLGWLLETRGESYMLDLARMLNITVKIEQEEPSPKVFEQAYMQEATQAEKTNQRTTWKEPISLQFLIERKQEVEKALKALRPAA